MYKQNLLNSFLYLAQRSCCPSPLCLCQCEEQSAYHVLTSCTLVDSGSREEINECMERCNPGFYSASEIPADYVSILNCSRDKNFILNCMKIVREDSLNFKTDYIIRNWCVMCCMYKAKILRFVLYYLTLGHLLLYVSTSRSIKLLIYWLKCSFIGQE